tara:strand:+ start:1540 stop:1812 length:273 start_codon:yes stop_codon:yes gene_type:complete
MTKSEQPGYAKTIHKEEDKLTLEQLQKLVGGYIQIVPLGNDKQMIINEEGKLMDLPYNETATKLMKEVYEGTTDWIAGDAIILTGKALLD